ncbi:MAG: hypothetical protein ACPG3T_02205 [Pseudomonadales bacterium]
MADRVEYLNFLDMIDGGGAGRSGDRFEGGGLLSLIANELMKPAGYEQRMLDRKNQTGRAVSRVVDELTKDRIRNRARMSEMERQRGIQQDMMDPRGANQMRPLPEPSDYPDMSMPSIPGYTAPQEKQYYDMYRPPLRQPSTGLTYEPEMRAPETSAVPEYGGMRPISPEQSDFAEARQQVIELMGPEVFDNLSPETQNDTVRYFMELRGY